MQQPNLHANNLTPHLQFSNHIPLSSENCRVYSYKVFLVGAGVTALLIRVVECGSELGKHSATRCLMKLTQNSDNAWSLLKICSGVDCKVELVGPACGVLRNLVRVEESKRFMVEEGAISMFIRLARSKDEALQMMSIEFLQSIAFGDELIREMVIREGGIRALVCVVDPKWSHSLKTREVALTAMGRFRFKNWH